MNRYDEAQIVIDRITRRQGTRGPGPVPTCGSLAVLTERELEVMTLVSRGLANKEIADRLSISDHTAKFHVGNVIHKYRARNRAHAAVLFVLRPIDEVA